MLFNTAKKINLILLSVIIVSISFAVFFYFSQSALAQNYGEDTLENINVPRAELILSIIRIINIVLGFLGLLAVILVLYAGYLWMTAGGNADQVSKAKKILINGVIGLTIILLSFAITMYIFNIFTDRLGGIGDPCSPTNSCLRCNIYCNADGETEYNNSCGYLCGGGGDIPEGIFKINSFVTSCNNPSDYNQEVHLCSMVVVNFNQYLDQESIEGAIDNNTLQINDCSNSSCSNLSQLSNTGDNQWTISNKSISFIHQDLFDANHFYQVVIPKTIKNTSNEEIDADDGCGSGLEIVPGCINTTTAYKWKFETGTTVDSVPPSIDSAYPIKQSEAGYPNRNIVTAPIVTVDFSEAVAPSTINTNNIKIRKVLNVDSNNPDNTGTLSNYIPSDEYVLDTSSSGNGFYVYNLILESFAWYEISVEGVKDLCNNEMNGVQRWRWQTSDVTPGIRTEYPKDGFDFACPNTEIFTVFNTSMYNPANNSCLVGSADGYVTSGEINPAVSRSLRVIDDYPGEPANPNDYCKHYEFIPSTSGLNVNTNYQITINTDLIINQSRDRLNHNWSFDTTSADECANAPVITRVFPNSGSKGECITIFGRYFDPQEDGKNTNDKAEFNNTQLTISTDAWTDNNIATSLPSSLNLATEQDYSINVSVDYGGTIGILESNSYDFFLDSGAVATGPCLFSISPDQDCFNEDVVLRGIRFDSGTTGNTPEVEFTLNKNVLAQVGWTDSRLKAEVPALTIDGDVVVKNSNGISNPLNFDVACAWCSLTSMCVPDNGLCAEDSFCDVTCGCQKTTSGNGPSIIKNWPRNCNNACQNTAIGAEFNMALNSSSLKSNNVKLFMCVDENCDWDELNSEISVNIDYFEDTSDDNEIFQLDIEPISNLDTFYYRVILKDNILSTTGENLREKNFSTTGGEVDDSFSWVFGTKNEVCSLDEVDIKPEDTSINYIGNTKNYRAYAYGRELDNCDGSPLNSSHFTWLWSSFDSSVATVLKNIGQDCVENQECGSRNCDENSLACTGNSRKNVVTANANGQTFIKVGTLSVSSSTSLIVNDPTADPPEEISILGVNIPNNYQSDCTNFALNVYFDKKINMSSVSSSTAPNLSNIGLWKEMTVTTKNNSSKNIFKLAILKIKNLIQKVFAQTSLDYVPTNIKSYHFSKDDIMGKNNLGNNIVCNSEIGCTQIKILSKDILEKDKKYKLVIKGGVDGIKSLAGGNFSEAIRTIPFETRSTAEVCLINKIEINPNRHTFTQADTSDFKAIAKTNNDIEIAGVVGVYDWAWSWFETDIDNIITISNSNTDIESVTANSINGNAILIAKAKIVEDGINTTLGDEFFGHAQINNFICLNPWPINPPYIDADDHGYGNFSLRYCRDKGQGRVCDSGNKVGQPCGQDIDCQDTDLTAICSTDNDNLPALTIPLQTMGGDGEDLLREYLLLRDDDSTDAIGIRILKNSGHLSLIEWYNSKNFTGSPQSMQVDSYAAIRDGRSVYILATSKNGINLYTNIYLISYSENSSQETIDVYNALLENIDFNINLIEQDSRICVDDDSQYCEKDADCATGACNANKTKIIRDTQRIVDLSLLKRNLENYYAQNSYYSKLEAGSYEIGHSTSKWPSWNQTLASELGTSLPTDPLNEFGLPCHATENDSYDQASCWNETAEYFSCPDSSYLYQYSTTDGTSFEIYGNMEYEDAEWANTDYDWLKNNTCQDFKISN
ncbi:hypothetical protein ACFL1Y_00560 [Patescibacteria group bacterium]